MTTKHYDSGTRWEEEIKYSRAIRRGNYICISGTTAMDGDTLVGEGDAAAQAAFIFKKLAHSLEQVDATLGDTIRTRMYITDQQHAAAVTAAHAEAMADVRSATTLLVVKGFIDPRLLVEIELDALVLP